MMTSEGKVSNPHDFLKVGDKVLYGKYAGDEIEVKDTSGKLHELKILRLDSVLGVVKK
jgi:co-chaperonin GroES (HSP10)